MFLEGRKRHKTRMLWNVWNLWLSRYRFVFNCYHHWYSLVLRNGNGMASIMHGREGMIQGDPLSIFVYGLGVLPFNITPEISTP